MSSVNVLAPNGRRQVVKCSPNTTILQIIEEVCKKQDLDSNEFDLKHHNKVLDTTNVFRFSGLPNNAQLELVKTVKPRTEQDITLAVSLENGSRLMGNFSPHETLLKILQNLCPEEVSSNKSPVVIYTRREIYGPALNTTTLKNLGLTGGRAMLRIIHKTPDELKVQANVSAPLPSKPVEEKPYRRTLIRSESPPKTTLNEPSEKPDNSANVAQTEEESFMEYARANMLDLMKVACAKRKSEEEEKAEEKRKSFSITETPNMEQESCLKMELDDCEIQSPKESAVEDDFVFLGSRNAMLFSFETAQAVPSEELPDDFFELTIDDAKKILRDVKQRRMEMDESPLLTAGLREMEQNKKELRQMNKYKKAVIRIQFHDRTVLQGTFLPTETVADIKEFVREYLEDKQIDFYIYSTPPKKLLYEGSRLIEIGCVPGALLHFGSFEKRDHFLQVHLRNKFTTNSIASLAACKFRLSAVRSGGGNLLEDEPMEVKDNHGDLKPSTSSAATNYTSEEYTGRKAVPFTENVPKWFKPPK